MKWSKLLERQLAKYAPDQELCDPRFQRFLTAVNDSYMAYERDIELAERAFSITEDEYRAVNDKLTQEVEMKRVSIGRLKEAVMQLSGTAMAEGKDELLDVLEVLRQEIEVRHKTEQELANTANRLTLLIGNLHLGILVEDEQRKIVLVNAFFCNLFQINQPPDSLIGFDCSTASAQSTRLFRNPAAFDARLAEILAGRKVVLNDELELADGRVYERDYIPMFIDGAYKGHMWKFRDITARVEAERKIKESEQLWQFALEGSGDGVWDLDFRTGQAIFSRQHQQMMGVRDGDGNYNGTAWYDMVHENDRPLLLDLQAAYAAGEVKSHQVEYRLRHKDGHFIWILDRGMAVGFDDAGQPVRIVGTHADITERKVAEEAVRRNEEKYRNIIANMNLGLLEVDKDEMIVFANHSFCQMSGYTEAELIHENAARLFARGENLELLHGKNALRQTGVSDVFEIAVKDNRGEDKWWLVSGAPNYDDAGHFIGSVGIHLDITEQKKLEHDLSEARIAAEESSRVKEAFLANMSHEIRTPMNAIINMCRQLERTQPDTRQKLLIDTIDTASAHLLVVINDILDISKIEAGKLEIESIPFRMQDVLKGVQLVMQPKADEKGLLLKLVPPGPMPPVFSGDPHRISQILLNLISNSIKFTDRGVVALHVIAGELADGRQQIEFSVKDTGAGMDEAFLKKVFDKFSQQYTDTARKFGGTGLGMAICRQLVELMGGEIRIASKLGEGTEVTFRIPLALSSEDEIRENDPAAPTPDAIAGCRVLMAEDNPMNRLVVRTILESYEVALTEVENGWEAVQELHAGTFDVVLMDIQMPVMNGLEATAIIRKNMHLDIPVIALTANAIKGESVKCMEAGMSGFVSKPFQEAELIRAIAAHYQVRSNGGGTPTAEGASLAPEATLYSLDRLRRIGNNNPGFVDQMVRLFHEQSAETVKGMQEARLAGDWGRIRSLAHKIRPSVDAMGVDSLLGDLQELDLHADESAGQLARLENVIAVLTQVNRQLQNGGNG